MTEYETISVIVAAISAFGSIVSAAAAAVAATGIWIGIRDMNRSNQARAAQAAEDRKATQALMAALERQGASLERQGAALERQGAALEELVRRTAPPQAGPAE